jgi:hypothetical protein
MLTRDGVLGEVEVDKILAERDRSTKSAGNLLDLSISDEPIASPQRINLSSLTDLWGLSSSQPAAEDKSAPTFQDVESLSINPSQGRELDTAISVAPLQTENIKCKPRPPVIDPDLTPPPSQLAAESLRPILAETSPPQAPSNPLLLDIERPSSPGIHAFDNQGSPSAPPLRPVSFSDLSGLDFTYPPSDRPETSNTEITLIDEPNLPQKADSQGQMAGDADQEIKQKREKVIIDPAAAERAFRIFSFGIKNMSHY